MNITAKKEYINLALIIVHYNNLSDTTDFVNSILEKIDTRLYKIIIVDNFSPNGSGNELVSTYKDNTKIDVVLLEKNVGVSGGWQAGIDYLRENYVFEFVALCNNDLLLIDKNLYKCIKEEYVNSDFAALGPMIITSDGRCDDNPIFDVIYSRENALYDLKYWKRRLKAIKCGFDKIFCFFHNRSPFVKSWKKKHYIKRKLREPGAFLQKRENVVLHGCFIVLSPKYFEFFEGIDARTFMYAEEDILFVHIMVAGLKTVYNPKIAIYHKGGSSVSSSFANDKKKKIFLVNNYIQAIEQYLMLLDEVGI